mgnify:FL=1
MMSKIQLRLRYKLIQATMGTDPVLKFKNLSKIIEHGNYD